ncbi:hypothetical protein DFJ77DRAFT_479617 [Powellomyces hirtus]|nr:hypothetical protein DFJ77DRAFT_479617 [Powellomyces hirtus]
MPASTDTAPLQQMRSAVEARLSDGATPDFDLVLQNVTMPVFDSFTEQDDYHCRLDFDNGTVRMRCVPTAAHEAVSYYISTKIILDLNAHGMSPLNAIKNLQTTTIRFPDGTTRKEPDAAFAPKGQKYPTVVVQVAWSQSGKTLREDAMKWMALPSVQMVIIIWIQDKSSKNLPRAMWLETFERNIDGTATTYYDIGEAKDLSDAHVHIPFERLFQTAPHLLDISGSISKKDASCILELAKLREFVLDAIKDHNNA